jgi:two-component system chemotaxis response regulator CheB
VIDDSAYNRVTLTRMLETDPTINVVGTAVNGEDGIKQVMKHRPDVITLDLEMPIMDGFAFLRWLMANLPTAVIAVSSRASDRSVFKALELGALDFIAKPGGRVSPRLEEIQRDLVAKVLQTAQVRMENLSRRVQEQDDVEPLVPAPRFARKGSSSSPSAARPADLRRFSISSSHCRACRCRSSSRSTCRRRSRVSSRSA